MSEETKITISEEAISESDGTLVNNPQQSQSSVEEHAVEGAATITKGAPQKSDGSQTQAIGGQNGSSSDK